MEVLPSLRAQCGAEMHTNVVVTETTSVTCTFEYIGEPATAPVLLPAQGAVAWRSRLTRPRASRAP